MVTADQLVEAFKQLRAGEGMTADKLTLYPWMKAAFRVDSEVELLAFIRDKTAHLSSNSNCKAGLVALALGYQPLQNLQARRLASVKATRDPDGNIQQNIRRKEDRGFQEMATHLVSLIEDQADEETDALLDVLGRLTESMNATSESVEGIVQKFDGKMTGTEVVRTIEGLLKRFDEHTDSKFEYLLFLINALNNQVRESYRNHERMLEIVLTSKWRRRDKELKVELMKTMIDSMKINQESFETLQEAVKKFSSVQKAEDRLRTSSESLPDQD